MIEPAVADRITQQVNIRLHELLADALRIGKLTALPYCGEWENVGEGVTGGLLRLAAIDWRRCPPVEPSSPHTPPVANRPKAVSRSFPRFASVI